MKSIFRKIYHFVFLIVAASLVLSFTACNSKNNIAYKETTVSKDETSRASGEIRELIVDEDGTYTSKDEVALYIYTYRKLPKNFIKKKDAEILGWKKNKKNLFEVTGGMSIGGDRFSNYEKQLPQVPGRTYYECDIDYNGGSRNSKRIVYADDFDEKYGFIFYTGDHYKTFEKLY